MKNFSEVSIWSGFVTIYAKNPLAWILAILLAWAVYDNEKVNNRFADVCDLTGPHEISVDHPWTNKQQIDNLCIAGGAGFFGSTNQ